MTFIQRAWLTTFCVATLCVCTTLNVVAQPGSRVAVSNSDPRWGDVVMVTYTAPDSSDYTHPAYKDTIYMAVGYLSAWGTPAQVSPMERKGKTAVWQAAFSVPDSAYRIRIEICEPTKRVPDGITIFTVQQPDGGAMPGMTLEESTDIDSGLAKELRRYPTRYNSYSDAFGMHAQHAQEHEADFSAAKKDELAARYVNALEKSTTKNLSWYMTMARLCLQRSDSKEKERASEFYAKAANYSKPDELLWNDDYWFTFFAYSLSNGQMKMPYERGRVLLPLALRFPTSTMARTWIQRVSSDTVTDKKQFEKLCSSWVTTTDVDVLTAITGAYLTKNSRLYDAATALEWSKRAEKAHVTRAGFFSGENIYGSMGRWSRVISQRMQALTDLGRSGEAMLLGRTALHSVSEQYEKDQLRVALMQACLAFHDVPGAERYLGGLVASSTRREYAEIDTLYRLRKLGDESRDDYIKRIARMNNGAEKLPAIQNFSFEGLDGTKGNTATFRGKIVVLDFWFIGCAGCAMERKSLDEFARNIKADTSVVLLSVALNDVEALKKYLKTSNPDFPVVPNGQSICDTQGIQGYPTHVILDRTGQTLVWEVGGSTQTGELLMKKVKELTAQR